MKHAFWLLFLLPLHSTASLCEDDIVVVFNGDWAPYFYRIDNQVYAGTDYEILSRTLRSMNCSLTVLPMNRRRSEREVDKGTFDFYLGASFTHERNQTYYFSKPYREEHVGFVTTSDAARATSVSLNHDATLDAIMSGGANIAINMDGYFGDKIEALKQAYSAQFVHKFSLPDRLVLLSQKRADIVVDDKTALCRAAQMPNSGLVLSEQTLHTDAIHFMLNRKTLTPEFVTTFNKHLVDVLEQNPELQRNRCDIALSRLKQRQ